MAEPSLEECYRVLGLTPPVHRPEIQGAFRRLVKQYHPDLSGAEADRMRFVRVIQAYRRLRRELAEGAWDDPPRVCPRCGEVAELLDATDGGSACVNCLLGETRRHHLLPGPLVRMVLHAPVVALLMLAGYALVRAVYGSSFYYAAWALGAGLAAWGSLAVTCLLIKHVR